MPDSTQPAPFHFYGVSHGNGNDGVSQLHPDYVVATDQPWRLARLALANAFRDPQWALDNAQIDGEEDHTISAVIHEGPHAETNFGSAFHITEVFRMTLEDVERLRMIRGGSAVTYGLAEAFTPEELDRVDPEEAADARRELVRAAVLEALDVNLSGDGWRDSDLPDLFAALDRHLARWSARRAAVPAV